MICGMPRILNRYIFNELAGVFFLSILILTGTALLSKIIKIIELLLTKGLPFTVVMAFVASLLPSFLIYTIPVALLVAVLVCFTRLSSDSEIIAMKASGIGLLNIMRPVMALSVIAFAFSLSIFLYVFPLANLNLKNILFEAARKSLVSSIEEGVFYDKFKGAVLYVEHIEPGSDILNGVFISEELKNGEGNVFLAKSARFEASDSATAISLRLFDGTLHRKAVDEGFYHAADFSSYTVELNPPQASSLGNSRSNRELFADGLLAKARAIEAQGKDPSPVMIDLHKRFALPASVFIFALIGVPLGIQKVRSARLTGFSIALFVALAYYVSSTALESLGETGILNPILSAWGSDIIFLVGGVFAFYGAAREPQKGISSLFATRPRAS